MTEIAFRVATEQDIALLCEMRKTQLIHEGIAATVDMDGELTAYFMEFLKTGQLYEVLGIAQGGVVAAGAVCFYTYPPSYTNKTGKIAYITNMFTAPEYRGQGLATRILALLEAEVARRGVTVMRLGASRLGRPVYEKFGFVQDNEWMSKRL